MDIDMKRVGRAFVVNKYMRSGGRLQIPIPSECPESMLAYSA